MGLISALRRNKDKSAFGVGVPMKPCETCRLRARYDAQPKSLLGRIWKWHTRWCPGWKSYLKSLPPDRRQEIEARYR
jgi:hypothetical protein